VILILREYCEEDSPFISSFTANLSNKGSHDSKVSSLLTHKIKNKQVIPSEYEHDTESSVLGF